MSKLASVILKINRLRRKLEKQVDELGGNSIEVLKTSQQLDKLLNEYYHLKNAS